MNIDEIKNKIKSFLINEMPNNDFELNDSTDLLNEWFLDSFGIINTIMFLETEFSISVSRSEINGDNFANLNSISVYILNKL